MLRCAHACFSREIPRDHAAKLEAFRSQYRTHDFAVTVSALALELAAVRNRSLYPNLRPRLIPPHEVFTVGQVALLVIGVTDVTTLIASELAL